MDERLTVTVSNGSVLTTDAVPFAAGRTPNRGPRSRGGGCPDRRPRTGRRRQVFRTTARESTRRATSSIALASAMQQGRAAAAHACGPMCGVMVDRTARTAVYGLPEVAGVGRPRSKWLRLASPTRAAGAISRSRRGVRDRRSRWSAQADLLRRRSFATGCALFRRNRGRSGQSATSSGTGEASSHSAPWL